MSGSLLDTIDKDTYFRMLATAVPEARAMSICDGHGVRVHGTPEGARKTLNAAILHLSAQDAEWYLGAATLEERPLQDGESAILARLSDSTGAAIGALLIVVPSAASASCLQRAEPIVQCVRNELALTSELDFMTAELTERYEELNLVYHTEDQVNYFREGRDALTNLVQNCNEYLDVSLTALVLKSKNIEVVKNSNRHPLHDSAMVIERLKSELYTWVERNAATIVINELNDPRASLLLRGVPYKILCTPILEGSGSVAGILVIVNDFSRANFTNSDKNLLSVMARKAGKIIQANYDSLTGLVNRGGFEYFLDAAVSGEQTSADEHCVLHVNIDQLRVVNDTAGHTAGDEVIRQIAATLAAHLRDTDTLARIGGDEFGVLLESCTLEDGQKVAEKMRKSIETLRIFAGERDHKATISVGVASLGTKSHDLASALAGAELACTECGEQGGNRVETYHDENSELIQRRKQMQLIEKIQNAIRDDQFSLYSQLIEPLQDDRQPRHFEILLRMHDGDDIVSPGLFIPAAERYHLMPAVDRWVVGHALAALERLPNAALVDTVFAINLSGQSFGDAEFLSFLTEAVRSCDVPKQTICFEITETAAIRSLAEAQHFITTLGALGCQFSLDDFGVGLSSFSYLKSLPVDHLKIDGEFVKDLTNDRVSAAMVAAINQIGHTMGLHTIAEFVENDEIRDRLVTMGIDFAQGYGIGRPIPLTDQLSELADAPSIAAV